MIDLGKSNVVLVCLLCLMHDVIMAEFKMASACYGAGNDCFYMSLECASGQKIRLISQNYGIKEDDCNDKKNKCLGSGGCCVLDEADCREPFVKNHAYDLHRECSGRQYCGPMQVPRNMMLSCNNRLSSYAYVTYECVSDDLSVPFCGPISVAKNAVHIMFDQSTETSFESRDCSCFISVKADVSIAVDYTDIRMAQSYNNAPGTSCSSAILATNPTGSDVNTTCIPGSEAWNNFVFDRFWSTGLHELEIILFNLYRTSANDAPEFIWLSVSAEPVTDGIQQNVAVTCFEITPQTTPPTSGSTRLVTSTRHPDMTSAASNGTDSEKTQTDAGSNTGVIVAGVLVPIILLAVAAGVVFFLYRRHGGLFKRFNRQKSAVPNRYEESGDIDEEYAEIGFVPDVCDPTPQYDAVYVPGKGTAKGNSGVVSPTCNGHDYQNVGNTSGGGQSSQSVVKKPFGKLRSMTGQLFSFFKKESATDQSESQLTVAKPRERGISGGSYDHLRPASGIIVYKPEMNDSGHEYSHTNTLSEKTKSQEPDKSKAIGTDSKDSLKDTNGNGNEDLKAVHIGDSYIEFKFGEVDSNQLVNTETKHDENVRPEPPKRPPPSPAALSPKHGAESQPKYDYAEGAGTPRASPIPKSTESDNTSEHSYKILEPQSTYDYADCSDNEMQVIEDSYGSIYEDVDAENTKSASVKKHKSATDYQVEPSEYLEPIESRTRTISSPGMLGTSSPRYVNIPKVKQILEDKASGDTDAKKSGKQAAELTETQGVVKSDNVKAKDYEKGLDIKGVRKMKEMFEQRESDSDSSRQSSPRQVTGKETGQGLGAMLKMNKHRRKPDSEA